ncbi:hypothetical protein DFO70_12547 [Cytobacillus firmus]|uniref:Uncharacterized protein n=2 Tax=Cytobacillus TaxID=2675230 RepID=A0A366JI86_CYTFI|nr:MULTISPECIES: hypothetical protein [Cytobacillus]RBP86579.1 hypothetical protein DFO70_12547 [Cytobacillus firmus]TDX39320.1 hypothetical protein DFO72_111151 [Cytobacillus oceanisediminis]
MWWLIGIGGLLSFGFIVDRWNKRKGINNFDPEENAKHVSNSEKIYMESHMHNVKNNNQDNGGGF